MAIGIEEGCRDYLSMGYILSRSGEGSGLIAQIDKHIQKLADVSSGGSPDQDQDPINHWKKELRNFAESLGKLMKKMPNNGAKRKPIEEAIQCANETIENYGGL